MIIHIAVDNLTWKTCDGVRIPEQVPHMLFTRKAIQASAKGRIRENASLPEYEEGYAGWKAGFLAGHAGAYSISIGDAVSITEQTWHAMMGCGKAP